ncbi:uncharacterized protein LOC129323066 isoform X1 [Prosopis cineraria]|uniref:uncharacterized protein LOC129323066 isoform X1 n=1 Tax=Prosopis cineraria TaxID=364024 RepID=UPI00241057F8|nr:uncharacterized protein LOC129323066 isoform X1 [Prosopis cineraria]
MAFRFFLHSNNQSLTFSALYRTIPSCFFSSRCRGHPLTLPSQSPPSPKKVPFTVSVHGKSWQDPYHWMLNTEDPDLLDHLNHENTYAQAFMDDTLTLQSTLSSEMRSRISTTISTPPERWGPWLYYQYIPEGKEYPVLCRRLETEKTGWLKTFLHYAMSKSMQEEVLLDWNELAEKYGYVHVGTCRVSPDHNYLAYTVDISGGERFMLQVKDLRSGFTDPKFGVEGVVNMAWARDGNSLFYTLSDENQRPYRVLCRKLANDHVNDLLVFTESDSSFCVDITSTKDGKFITVNSNSRTSSEVYVINAANPMDGLERICKRASGVQYFVEHHYGLFYILTNAPISEGNWSRQDLYLARCRVVDIKFASWQNIILPPKDMSICDMDIFNGHLVLLFNKKGLPVLCSLNLPVQNDCKYQMDVEDLKPWYFPMPSNTCSAVPGSNHDFMNTVYRVVLSSPVMPDVIVDYDMSKHAYSMVHQEEVNGASVGQSNVPVFENEDKIQEAYNAGNGCPTNSGSRTWRDFSHVYGCQREEVISHDGVRIPLTIVYSRESWKKGQSPGILLGYGAYGEVLDKSWCVNRLSLLDRGWVVAFADVRGGGGGSNSSWHESGSGLNKHNSIYDFVSCGQYLVNESFVQRDQLGAIGWSAGCLLVGAAMNMYPDLFRASILKVPFLDICNTLLDSSLPLTILDYEEFGNPQIPSQFDSIFMYSPYDNISEGQCYPSVLVASALNDSRVGVWEGAKWVAKVRDRTCYNCSRAVIMKTSMVGGHFGEGGHYGQCDEAAYEYAFLMKAFGILNN